MDRLASKITYANVVATLALFLALGGGAYAALGGIPDAAGVFHGCVNRATGALRVVNGPASCHRSRTVIRAGKRIRLPGELPISWNQKGPQGLAGLRGPTGATGATGQAGIPGPGAVSLVFTRATGDGVPVQLAQIAGFTISVTCVTPYDTEMTVSHPSAWAYNVFGQIATDDANPSPFSTGAAVSAGGAVTDMGRLSVEPSAGHFERNSAEVLLTTGSTTEVAVAVTQIDDARGGGHPPCSVIGQAVPST